MGLRFWRRVRIIPGLRVNLSKSGASLSIGHRGAWYTVGPHGRRVSLGLPGTGSVLDGAHPAAQARPCRPPPRLRHRRGDRCAVRHREDRWVAMTADITSWVCAQPILERGLPVGDGDQAPGRGACRRNARGDAEERRARLLVAEGELNRALLFNWLFLASPQRNLSRWQKLAALVASRLREAGSASEKASGCLGGANRSRTR
jgi:hypothetical protein